MAENVIRLTGLDGVYGMLRSLPAEVVSKSGGPAKTALRKGARVILAAEKANLRAVTSNATKEGSETTGLLAKNLVVTRGKAPSEGKGERYLVRVKRKAYVRKGKQVTTLKSAQLLEYGSSQQPAEPWIRPAFLSKAEEAIRTIERELVDGIDRIASRLMRQGGA